MKKEYAEWIAAKGLSWDKAYGKCHETSVEMQKVFPELILCRGWYQCPFSDEHEHWWLKTPGGEIIDPTAIQFPSKGNGVYREFVVGVDKEAKGKCPECGEYFYDESGFCCPEHERSYRAYLMGGPL